MSDHRWFAVDVSVWSDAGDEEATRAEVESVLARHYGATGTVVRDATDEEADDAGHAAIILLAALPVIVLAVVFVARLLGTLAGTVTP